MPRKNKNARKVYRIDFARFSRQIGLTPYQRVKTIKFIRSELNNILKGGENEKDISE